MALPENAWERGIALPWLMKLRFEVPVDPKEQSEEERDFIMETREWFEQYQQQLRGEGRQEGRVEALARGFEQRLGRALSERERRTLAERLVGRGEGPLFEVLFTLAPEALARWLAEPTAL